MEAELNIAISETNRENILVFILIFSAKIYLYHSEYLSNPAYFDIFGALISDLLKIVIIKSLGVILNVLNVENKKILIFEYNIYL